MSNVDTFEDIEEFAKFRAAHALARRDSSATEVEPVELAPGLNETVTTRMKAKRLRQAARAALYERPLRLPAIDLAQAITDPLRSGESTVIHESAFSILDELRTPEGRIEREISSFRTSSSLPYRDRLARRLEFLLSAMEEDGEAWTEDSPLSLRRMLMFLERAPHLKCPTVTVTPAATFRAQWTVDEREHFAIEFLADGQVRFVVFAPNPKRPDRIRRVSGITSSDTALNEVRPYEIEKWAADARGPNSRN